MGISLGGGKGTMAEPNVVPLIDILLVLIIIFMVITPTIPKGLEALVPQPNPNKEQANPDILQKTVVVQVLCNDPRCMVTALKINEEPHTWQSLGPRIEEIFKQRAEKIAFVKGDSGVMFSEVARAIDVMRTYGVAKVGLITAKIEAGE
ncbi:MAG: biopolymer transporter ExbD [Acidobacteria bacterium]|nr:biopolymer transporter ExbD [Acidobacteriota bacterium]MCL5288026.1 biopolymer transporter ExbD [Acidobacteriota bacterium]